MIPPLPDHHENSETTYTEPVYLFTDKAVVAPPRQDGARPLRLDPEQTPTADPSQEEKAGP
jgi:hypothetical protein